MTNCDAAIMRTGWFRCYCVQGAAQGCVYLGADMHECVSERTDGLSNRLNQITNPDEQMTECMMIKRMCQ